MRVKDHPLSELFPLLDDSEIAVLADDIKANGQQLMITLYEGKILDGRNRYRACMKAGVEPKFKSYSGKKPLEHVLSLNLNRRHLSESQRAIIAAKIANLQQGNQLKHANLHVSDQPPVSQSEAAEKLNVSTRSVATAKKILEESPEKAREIEQGKKTVHAAAKELKAEQEKKDKPSKKEANLPKDALGVAVPAKLVPLWERRDELGGLAEMVSKVRVAIGKAQDKEDPLFAHINHSSTIAALDQAYAAIAGSKPHCVCPMCQGMGCRACRKTGLLGKFQFKTFVPKELKKDEK